jgi:hypothetical protein
MMQTVQTELHLKDTCKKILDLDTKIRFVGAINERGRLITGAVKEKLEFLVEEKKDREMLFMEVALRTRMRQEFDHCLGLVDFCLTHRENIVIITLPIRSEILYVSAEKGLELNRIPFEIQKILKNSD